MSNTTIPQTTIRQATESDFEAMLPVFLSAITPEENYVFTTNASREDIFAYWFAPKITTYVIEGYQAVQLNLVVSTNKSAIALWQKLGFSIIGTSPKAFKHKQLGYVDINIMYRFLSD